FQTQGQPLLNGYGGFHTIAAVAIAHTETQRYDSIAADPETEEHLFELITPVFAMSIGRPGGSWGLRFVCVCSIQGNSRRVLMQPLCGNGIDLQGVESHGAIHLVEISRK